MIRLDMRLIPIAVLVLLSVCRLSFAAGEMTSLTGDTSRPRTSTFVPGTSFYRCAITEDGTCIVGG